jgi:hypothetical protein
MLFTRLHVRARRSVDNRSCYYEMWRGGSVAQSQRRIEKLTRRRWTPTSRCTLCAQRRVGAAANVRTAGKFVLVARADKDAAGNEHVSTRECGSVQSPPEITSN